MKIKLSCTYYNEKHEKIGEPGDILDLPKAEADLLIPGSAELVEPPKKSERD